MPNSSSYPASSFPLTSGREEKLFLREGERLYTGESSHVLRLFCDDFCDIVLQPRSQSSLAIFGCDVICEACRENSLSLSVPSLLW